jgi:molybdate transport system regulatory protein
MDMNVVGKLFLEDQGRYILGPGRAALLRSVETLGSLHKAAQHQGMSYRWAWGRLKDTENALKVKLLSQTGTPLRGNVKSLTPEGRELLAWFDSIEKTMDAVLEKAVADQPGFLRMQP